MTHFRAILAYDGTAYYGYQRQAKHLPTVQATVETALEAILKVSTPIIGAGRTDAGVHANGQVISFDAMWQHKPSTLLRALNATLPADIAVYSLDVVPDSFHPRYDALSRTYHYTIVQCDVRQPLLHQRAWQMHGALDDASMQNAAQILIGKRDFAALGTPPQGSNTIREIYKSDWVVTKQPYGRDLVYRVTATAFLYHMVRRIVALLVKVGQGRITPEQVQAILDSKDLARAKQIAPPQGLVLTHVAYALDV